jgi:hypothetical protein
MHLVIEGKLVTSPIIQIAIFTLLDFDNRQQRLLHTYITERGRERGRERERERERELMPGSTFL